MPAEQKKLSLRGEESTKKSVVEGGEKKGRALYGLRDPEALSPLSVREAGGRPRQKEERKRKQAGRDYRSEASLEVILSTRGSRSSPRKEGASHPLHHKDERNVLISPGVFFSTKVQVKPGNQWPKHPGALSQQPGLGGGRGREVRASPPAFINKIQKSTLYNTVQPSQ